jgi:hypothetical protein
LPLRVFNLFSSGNQNQYTYEQSPKNRTAISAKMNFLEIIQYRRHILEEVDETISYNLNEKNKHEIFFTVNYETFTNEH